MKYDFLIIGVGMQGKIAARDLLEHGYSVFLADLYEENAEKILKYPKTDFAIVDLANLRATTALIRKVNPSVVLNCAEGDWNLNLYKACLKTKKHVLDLGSDIPMTKAQLAMDKDFRRHNLIAITGCGSTPGINNIMLHHAHQFFDRLETVEVGFAWDSNIKKFVVPFSIQSIIEEFTDPAPIIKNGKWLEVEPLDYVEERTFREIGKQQCFFVRHPETYTFYINNKRAGLRNLRFYAGFPTHSAETIKTFISSGLGSKSPIVVENKKIIPVKVLSQVLKKLPVPDGYTEKENLWVHIWGRKNKRPREVLMECIVNTLPGWEEAGCNIDTGMPASIIAQMVKNGLITARGSYPPGGIVLAKYFFRELRKRGMKIYQNGRIFSG